MVNSSSSSLPAGVGDEKMKDDILIRDCHTELVEVLLCSQVLRQAQHDRGTRHKVQVQACLSAVGGG